MTLLYSVRSAGWLTDQSTYTSDWKLAKRFSHSEALERAKLQKRSDGFGMIPVRLEDLEAI